MSHTENHASKHIDGTDDIQSASASQKGLMGTAYASRLDGLQESSSPVFAGMTVGGVEINKIATSSKTADYTILSSDMGKNISVATSTDSYITFTLPTITSAMDKKFLCLSNNSDYTLLYVACGGSDTIGTDENTAMSMLCSEVVTLVADYANNNWKIIYRKEAMLVQNKTVNLTSSMTGSTLYYAILAQPKNLGGKTLTFQFADGTYTLTLSLIFRDYFNGSVSILGNTGESGLHSNQAVIFDSTGYEGGIAVRIMYNSAPISMSNIKVLCDTTSGSGMCVYAYVNSQLVTLIGGYFYGNNTALGYCIYTHASRCYYANNYVGNANHGIYAIYIANIISSGNSSGGTMPVFGLSSRYGSVIHKKDASQPLGSSANEFTDTGGLIR